MKLWVKKRLKSKLTLIGIIAFLFLLPGCYLYQQGKGQLILHKSQVPIEKAIQEEGNPKYKRLLIAVPEIKYFAEQSLYLKKSENYTSYFKTEKKGVSFVVTAAKKHELSPYTWWFPIIGSVPYKGFFNRKDAVELEQELQSEGYDTLLFAAPAYSTLGWFNDPVTTPMLKRGYFNFAETIFHEMAHTTVYVNGQGNFNEQLASFVGEKGALQYFHEKKIFDQVHIDRLMEKRKQHKRYVENVRKYIPELRALYSKNLPLQEVLQKREEIFDKLVDDLMILYPHLPRKHWKFNNAKILQFIRYRSESRIIKEVWERGNGDWKVFWAGINKYVADKF